MASCARDWRYWLWLSAIAAGTYLGLTFAAWMQVI